MPNCTIPDNSRAPARCGFQPFFSARLVTCQAPTTDAARNLSIAGWGGGECKRATITHQHRPAFVVRKTLLSRSEEHTSELQSLMRISYAVFCLKKKINKKQTQDKKKTIIHYKTTV